ncbi:MAG: hypothetical protein OMM_14590 [Candidatus Magnetoglobus multicellularis str. Araruama]|uniref:Uncharacterized protein n=1 Tax=Candidatus Magnetoglobus multicellularis str. Araruama TaxID=890399 RepID=A0A1V1NRK6_9BACT|nr:MAG: hypothetical protein OMM_14590 [Candidatus Magnetoglobus multicellularis str. Araruama]
MVTGKNFLDPEQKIIKAKLVVGSVVIASDYFKRLLAGLRNIFGGQVNAYETLIDRARREAILRMKSQAEGAAIILNMRIETTNISRRQSRTRRNSSSASIEAIAYGTALYTE